MISATCCVHERAITHVFGAIQTTCEIEVLGRSTSKALKTNFSKNCVSFSYLKLHFSATGAYYWRKLASTAILTEKQSY